MRVFLLALVSLGIVGCATVPDQVAPESAVRIKRIAPISVVADVFAWRYVGLTVFGNEYEEMQILDWGVDSAYEDQLSSTVERTLGLTVVRAKYPVADFTHVNDADGLNWDKIEEPARAYCAANSLDALVVAAKTKGVGRGVGTYTHGAIASYIHVRARVGLVDCATGKLLAVRTLDRPKEGVLYRAVPMANLSREITGTPISRWSPDTKEKLRAQVVELPREFWAETLLGLFPNRK